ncbi:hypothetical protein B296_00024697 [Ensete ventricosum]|uniref:Uncharacterized protein n=1 Tax=Ensete ventricosum TaxID=4639 RepID=A0A426Y6F5_ENSVE|nr:hypothetical protein B296_00024697 [Ensete ventricosum]
MRYKKSLVQVRTRQATKRLYCSLDEIGIVICIRVKKETSDFKAPCRHSIIKKMLTGIGSTLTGGRFHSRLLVEVLLAAISVKKPPYPSDLPCSQPLLASPPIRLVVVPGIPPGMNLVNIIIIRPVAPACVPD